MTKQAQPSRVKAAALQYGGVLASGAAALLFLALSPSNKDISLATTALVFGIAATGLGFLWGQVGEVDIAHAAVFGVGAYTAGIAQQHGNTFVTSLGLSMLAGCVAAVIVALPSLRTRGHYFIILTFAVGEVAVVVATRLESVTGGVDGLTALPKKQSVFGLSLLSRHDYFLLVLCIGMLLLLALLAVSRSRWGATLRGIRENEQLATALGTPVVRHRILAFAVSGAIGGLGGQLYLYHLKFVDPSQFNVQVSIFFLLMVLLGGRRYLLGPMIGALVYTFLPQFIFLSPNRSEMLLGLILVVMILVLPAGLLSLPSRLAHARALWRSGRPAEDKVIDADEEFDEPTSATRTASGAADQALKAVT